MPGWRWPATGWRIACGVAALLLTLLSTGPIRPAPAVGAAVGGLAAVALLRATDLGFTGSSALAAAAAVTPLLASGYRHAGRRSRRRARRGTLAAAVVVAVLGAAYAAAAVTARPAVEQGMVELRAGLDAARAGDDVAAAGELSAAAASFGDAEDRLGAWWAVPATWLPGVGPNADAVETLASGTAAVAREAAAAAVDADTDTLTVQGGRLDLDRVAALAPPLERVQAELAGMDDDIDGLDSPWLLAPVADRRDRVATEVAAAAPEVDLAADAVGVLPAMFGADGTSRWFVAFVTPVEARGRTGFMGNFAELTAVDGQVTMTRFGRASELESGGTPGAARTISGPADYLDRWERFDPETTWRNVTMSPDFPSIGAVMAELYPQSGGQPVDGVIAVDPEGLAALMQLTGPVPVSGLDEPLTADGAAEFLLQGQYTRIEDNEDRIDALESLARGTFDRLTTGDLPGPRAVADALGRAVAGGHLHAWGADPDQQALFEDVGLDGALDPVRGDFLGVVSNNAVGNKIDLFLQRDVAYDVNWDPATGALFATATVTLTNSAPAEGLPPIVIGSPLSGPGSPPSGTNRTYLSVYTPWILDGAVVDGAPAEIERQVERDRYAYSLFLDVPPGGTRTVTLELRGLLGARRYGLDVATQPLVRPDRLDLAVEVGDAGSRTLATDQPLTEERTRYRPH